ncbi:MAG TPA: DUF4040 domain-containing protein [Candidatus Omnitrophica bacterium]|nr:DUF4040 domain-containing protein [Candidatus Omnitrophota bacterium]
MLELNLIMLFVIIAAFIAVEMKDLLSAVVSVAAAGLGLCIIFLILKAPDIAITQLVVEIFLLIILIRATIRKDLPFSTSGRWFFNTVMTVTFLIIFLSVGYFVIKQLPQFGHPLMRVSGYYLSEGLEKTRATNLVTSILLGFRAYDTLGEATVLFTAVISVLAVMRKKGRKKIGEAEDKYEL